MTMFSFLWKKKGAVENGEEKEAEEVELEEVEEKLDSETRRRVAESDDYLSRVFERAKMVRQKAEMVRQKMSENGKISKGDSKEKSDD